MAEIVSSLVNGSQVKVVYSYTQNIAANTSTVSATLWVHRDSYGPSYDTSCSAYININGSRAMTYTSSFNIGSSWVQIGGTGSVTVAHNSDGAKVCNITGYFSSSITSKLTDLSVSQSVTLTTIPRASTLTSTPSITIGDNFDAGINRADSSFTHSASIFVSMSETSGYSHIKTIDGIGTSFNSNFSDAEIQTMFGVVPAGNTGYLQIQLTTYSGSTEIESYTWVRGRAYTAAPTSPTFDNVNIGNVMAIGTNRARLDYTHTVSVAFGSWSATIGTGVATSVNWNTASNAANLYAQIPNANSGIGLITVTTYSHGANIGSRSANFTAYVVNSNPTFTGFTYKDTNTSSVTISGDSTKVIQDVSNVQVTINGAAAKNSATISSYKVQYGSKSLSSSSNVISFGTLPNNDSFIVTVIDSRGNSAQQSLAVSVIPYARPTITALTLSRVNDIEANSILTCGGTYAHCMITTGHYALKYRYKATSSSTWSDYVGITSTLTQDNYTFSASIGDFDIGTSYNFEVVPYDYFYSNTGVGFLPTSKPLLSLRKEQIGINKIPQQGGLDVSGDVYLDGKLNDAYLPGTDGSSQGGKWPRIPSIKADGVLEVGKYIDFHETSEDTSDFDVRIECANGTLNTKGDARTNGVHSISRAISGETQMLSLQNNGAQQAALYCYPNGDVKLHMYNPATGYTWHNYFSFGIDGILTGGSAANADRIDNLHLLQGRYQGSVNCSTQYTSWWYSPSIHVNFGFTMTSVPVITTGLYTAGMSFARISDISTTGFNFWIVNPSAATGMTFDFHWRASWA